MKAESSTATRIVGIGASAGGLIALDHFFQNVPLGSGLAYIVVQHMDPTKKALLPELLQRITTMKVCEALNNAVIEPDHVYVIPPNRELTVTNGKLQLAKSNLVRNLRLPVNTLFSSLASAQGDKAIVVVLSGMGSDGTLGLQAVKSCGGLTLAQTPATAEFPSMPESAIQTGCVDIIEPCEVLPVRIADFVKGIESADSEVTVDTTAINAIVKLLRAQVRHDFSLYKTSTLVRRIERRVAVHGLNTMTNYAIFLESNPAEIDLLFKELLIGVTSFFRDPAVWEYLQNSALPVLLGETTGSYKFRAWCAGCSTGEEAYSLAIALVELVEQLPNNKDMEVQIFASDLSADAIAFARRGKYPLSIASHISKARLDRFFSLREGSYVVNQHIRDKVLFAQHDLVLDPPFTKLDLLVCRNLLIYFDSKLQQRLLPLFHYSLRPGGLMLLGSSETIGNTGHLFEAVQSKLRFYQRRNSKPSNGADMLFSTFPSIYPSTREQVLSKPTTTSQAPSQSLQSAADHVLLQVYAPAAVVVNSDSDIVYISGRTGKYLEPAAGKANWNFHAMVRDGLRAPLFSALKRAVDQGHSVEIRDLQVELENEESLIVDVTVQLLHEPAILRGMFLIVFRDAGLLSDKQRLASSGGSSNATTLEELRRQQEENQTLREENRASQEELQASNEELQSTNEELQSTNEELTTSKEEMQSMNEELQTINTELQAKLDDLALAQSDMQNLLNSTEIAILFLDAKLNVRRYTERAAKIISLRESDVGRPLSDLRTVLQYPELSDDAKTTMRTLAFSEKEVSGSDGRLFLVRIMPYKRLDNVIDGVVITLIGIEPHE